MFQRTLIDDAISCRVLASEFEGRQEEAFLHRLASEFQMLASPPIARFHIKEGDLPYFAQRASQEVTAAIKVP